MLRLKLAGRRSGGRPERRLMDVVQEDIRAVSWCWKKMEWSVQIIVSKRKNKQKQKILVHSLCIFHQRQKNAGAWGNQCVHVTPQAWSGTSCKHTGPLKQR